MNVRGAVRPIPIISANAANRSSLVLLAWLSYKRVNNLQRAHTVGKKTADNLKAVHSAALREFDKIQAEEREMRLQCMDDRRFCFVQGAQWDGKAGEQFGNRPKFEVDKVYLAIQRAINEYRNNRITADFVPKDGSTNDALADTCDSLFRADEQDSAADEAYDNAFEEAISGGIGAWRLRAEYEDELDEENDKQRIRFEPIFDADSTVFFDLNCKRQDKADATSCYVLTPMSVDAYRDEYDDDPTTWPQSVVSETTFDWRVNDSVFVAELYKVETGREDVVTYRSLDGEEVKYSEADFVADEMLEQRLEDTGWTVIRTRKVLRRKVRKYIMSGSRILEDCGHIAGDQIPIVMVFGSRHVIDGREYAMGKVRKARDSQVLYNMQLSHLGEVSALSPVEKPIFAPEQVAGHEETWATDNVKNFAYMLVNPLTDSQGGETAMGPLGYTKPPSIPTATAALLQIANQDISDVLGRQEQGDEMLSNMSGVAVEQVQTRLDGQSYLQLSNFARGKRRCGVIWLSMAKDIMIENGRKVKGVDAQGGVTQIELMRRVQDETTGAPVYENDLTQAKFDVAVEVGPASESKRAAMVRSFTSMMGVTADQELQSILGQLALMNMEGEGLGEMRDWLHMKLVRAGVLKPTDEEQETLEAEQQNAQPDPQAALMQAAAQEAAAKAGKAEADTELSLAKVEDTKANTLETLSGIQMDERESAVNTAQKLSERGTQ